MEFLFAPLEGYTYPEYRKVHNRIFPGTDCYYSPFIAPSGRGEFKPGFLERLHPDIKYGIPLVPQILANNPLAFVDTARKLQDLGYNEVNLNVGCPSGTVFAKHKGSGMLTDLYSLEDFLDTVFSGTDVGISIKTRMGVLSTGEFPAILEIYNRYPIKKLIIHARDRAGMYQSTPDIEAFISALSASKNPVCYNGDIFSADDFAGLIDKTPNLQSVMIGRGLLANPALIRMLRGGVPLQLSEFREFHDSLIEAYLARLDEHITLNRMKSLWYYMDSLFDADAKLFKAIGKAKNLADYKTAISSLYSCRFKPCASFIAKE